VVGGRRGNRLFSGPRAAPGARLGQSGRGR
jgi:hypothetical protein